MPQEDYLKRQIDQFAKALEKLLMKLSGLKGTTDSAELTRLVNEVFEQEGLLSIEALVSIPSEHFMQELLQTNKLTTEHLELLGEVLFNLSDRHPMEKELLTRTQVILEHIHAVNNTYSLQRHFRIDEIKRRLQF